MAQKRQQKQPKNTPFSPDGWGDPWKYITQAPDTAFAPQAQENRPPQAPPMDPAWEAWLAAKPGYQNQVYAEYGNPALLNDPNASFVQRYGYQGTQLLNNLGLNEQGQIDPTNPWGQASLLQRSFQQGQKSTTGNLASRGQGYSSYMQNKLDQGTDRFNQGFSGLQSNLNQGLHGLTQTGLGRLNELNTQTGDRLGDHQTYVQSQPIVPAPIGQFLYQQAGSPRASAPSRPGSSDGQSYGYRDQRTADEARRKAAEEAARRSTQQARYVKRRKK